jgi:hypothetical protein
MWSFVPPLVFLIWALIGRATLPDLRDPQLRTAQSKVLWAFWQLFDRREWTEQGLRVRRAWLRHALLGLALYIVAFLVVGRIRPD